MKLAFRQTAHVVWYTFCGFILGIMAAGFVAALGDPLIPDGSLFGGLLLGGIILICTAIAGVQSYQGRPRGWGYRERTRWKDGKPETYLEHE